MFASAIYNIFTANGYIPLEMRISGQIVIGAYIGLSFSKDSIGQIKELIGPIIVMVIGLFAASILLGLFISKVTGMDLVTSMLGSSPGGLTEMSIIADSYDADVSKVVIMHLTRLIGVVVILPILIRKVIEIFGNI
jgi:membrane AbrB-like protein